MNRKRTVCRFLAVTAILPLSLAVAAAPDASLNLKLAAPITTWDEAVPLGNGLLGGLLWGEGNTVRLSLDRGDLWDLRTPPQIHEPGFTYANLQKLVREKNQAEISRLTDAPYRHPTPTKIPAGRLELTLDAAQQVERFELNLATAEGRAWLAGGGKMDVFFSAAQPIALARIPGPEPKEIRVRVSGSGSGGTGPDSHAVAALGYPPARPGRDGTTQWFVQETAGDLKYCVCVASRRAAEQTLLAVTVTSNSDGPDPLHVARQRVAAALEAGYDRSFAPHADWWAAFWAQSDVRFPDPDILRHYYLVRYFHGAASRLGSPPMPLQGVWTADAGSLPPWKGDYHNDLNTQMTYMAYQAAGHFDEGACFLDFNWDLLPAYRRFARDFFGTPGANVPGVMSLAGDPLTGWAQYSLSPTMGPWIGHLFYQHWRYTADDDFLRTRAYPWCRELGLSLRTLLQGDEQGRLKLPLSSSPEIHNNSLRAWLVPNSNYDLFCLKMFFLSLAEMADAAGESGPAKDWADTAAALGDWHVSSSGVLMLDANEELRESHRHLSNLMGLYPFNLVTIDGGERDRRIIQASLQQWDQLGTSAWCGYSFSWMAALRARVGDAEAALRYLDIYTKAFILRNGFHANGDQTKSGYSNFTYRPFTLEGNFLAAAAVHEMLLQSWSPTPGRRDTEVLRIFPATPSAWNEASFEDLRAEGGHRVSAKRAHGVTTWFRVVAGKDGVVRVRDNFGSRVPKWNVEKVQKVGDNFQVTLDRGAVLEATLTRRAVGVSPPVDPLTTPAG
ncbi:MAG TPA: glycoside hydrolase N-terminal domain-containing protein [Candidatus Anammoximicrobium sp.]|nr:glycoside hydrolase N-terminal domain-containing protein [Candidatus Anammoximicrobium sp.]